MPAEREMIQDRNEAPVVEAVSPMETLNPGHHGFWQRVKDRLWGYDFFISYHWASGGVYAVVLAQRLRDLHYDVFLDRADYASGDDWKLVGESALRNTQRLLLVATREAVTISKPVEREVILFTSRNRHVIRSSSRTGFSTWIARNIQRSTSSASLTCISTTVRAISQRAHPTP